MATTISANGTTTLTSTTADDTVTFSVAGQAVVICRGSGRGGATAAPGAGGAGGQSTTKAYLVAAGDAFHYKIPAGGAANTAGSLTAFDGTTSAASQYAGGGGDGTAGKGDSIRAGGAGGAVSGNFGGGGGSGAGNVAVGVDGAAGTGGFGGVGGTAPTGGGNGGSGGDNVEANAVAGSQPGGGGGGAGSITTAAAGGAGSITITYRANETMPVRPVIRTIIRPMIRSLIN